LKKSRSVYFGILTAENFANSLSRDCDYLSRTCFNCSTYEFFPIPCIFILLLQLPCFHILFYSFSALTLKPLLPSQYASPLMSAKQIGKQPMITDAHFGLGGPGSTIHVVSIAIKSWPLC